MQLNSKLADLSFSPGLGLFQLRELQFGQSWRLQGLELVTIKLLGFS